MDVYVLLSVEDGNTSNCDGYNIKIIGIYVFLLEMWEDANRLAGHELSWTRLDPKTWQADNFIVETVRCPLRCQVSAA